MEKKLSAKEIIEYHTKDIPSAPGIGIKYFEPKGTFDEQAEISSLLNATKELLSYKKVQKLGSLSQALWHPDMQKAEVIHQVGSCWSSIGHMVDKKLFLFPEEALYLLETGILELYYGDMPLSIQRAYSLLLEPVTDLSEDCYRVYSQLTANGYKVLRHNASNILTKYEKQLQIHKAGIKVKKNIPATKIKDPVIEVGSSEMKKQKLESLSEIFENTKCVEDEASFLNNLKIFKPYEGNDPSTLQVHYDAYLSSDGNSSFRKSCHQLPKVRIVVHRSSDEMPDMKNIYSLLHKFEDEVPIIHAVVFPDFVSFFNIEHIASPICE